MVSPFDPHPGIDLVFALVEVHRAVRQAKTPMGRAVAMLRQADLERRAGAPEAALELLDTIPAGTSLGPLTVAGIRCAALTDSGQFERASGAIEAVPVAFGAWALAKASWHLWSSQADGMDAARGWAAQATQLSTGHPLAVEVRFDAHLTAAWLAVRSGHTAGAVQQLDAALACVSPIQQPLTVGWLQAIRPHLQHYEPIRDALFRQATDTLVAKYTNPVEHHRERLGGVPIEVHGVRMQHGDDSDRFAKGIVMMATVVHHRGDVERAATIANTGGAIASRLFGEPVDRRLVALLGELQGSTQ